MVQVGHGAGVGETFFVVVGVDLVQFDLAVDHFADEHLGAGASSAQELDGLVGVFEDTFEEGDGIFAVGALTSLDDGGCL